MDVKDTSHLPCQLTIEEYLQYQSSQINQLIKALNWITPMIANQASNSNPDSRIASPITTTLTAEKKDAVRVLWNVHPTVPIAFDDEHQKGCTFWNSVEYYMCVCGREFPTEDSKILWVLSYMTGGHAATFAEKQLCIFQKDQHPFHSWLDFRAMFEEHFFSLSEKKESLNTLVSEKYFQSMWNVEEYIDTFNELIFKLGHTDGLAIVVLFRKGLNTGIQNWVATMQARPMCDNYEGWCSVARLFDQDRLMKLSFNASLGQNAISNTMKATPATVIPALCIPVVPPCTTCHLIYPQYQAAPFPPPRPIPTYIPPSAPIMMSQTLSTLPQMQWRSMPLVIITKWILLTVFIVAA